MKKIFILTLTMIVGTLLFAACSNENTETEIADNGDPFANYPNAHLLVDVDWLEENLTNENIQIVDMRSEGYEGGHIPGAVPLTWQELNDPNHEISGMILPQEEFEQLMGQLGISNDTTVVAYDEGMSMAAARLFFALEYYGHANVKVLHGGFTAWLTEGKELSTDGPEVEPGTFTATANENLVVTKEFVLDHLDHEDYVILDVRSPEEYSGEDVRAERGGHIPNAVNLNWTETMETNEYPIFKPYEELASQFASVGVEADSGKTILPYCQTNARGAHTYFTLRLLGFEDVNPYEGSWAEWGNHPETPISTTN